MNRLQDKLEIYRCFIKLNRLLPRINQVQVFFPTFMWLIWRLIGRYPDRSSVC